MAQARYVSVTIPVGSSFSIDQVANDGGGACRFRTTVAHGFIVGEVVLISNSSVAAYNGLQTITNISDVTHFDVAAEAFAGDATATVTQGTAVTPAIDLLPGERVIGVETPSAWAAADIVFQIARNGSTFLDLLDINATLLRVMNIAINEMRVLANDLTAIDVPQGPHKIRLRSSAVSPSAANVNQVQTPILYVLLSK